MFKKTNDLLIILGIAVMFESGAFVVTVAANKLDRSISTQRRTPTLSKGGVGQLVLIPDTDGNGRVSERKSPPSICAQFDGLERGEPELKTLAQSRLPPKN